MTENLEMEVILPPLPLGWAWARVEDLGVLREQTVLTGPFGSNLGRDDFVADQEDAVPVLTIGCLQSRGINREKAVFVAADKAAQMERYRLRHGDIMFSRMATVGRAGLIERAYEGALFNYHLMRLRLERSVIQPYFFIYFVRGAQVVVDHVRSVNHGMTRDGINTEQLISMPVAVAPRQEQERIVSAIESYFTRLDDAVTTLDRVERNLKRYRASVLKSAVEGRLVPTEAALAKQEGRDYEPASVLLERILTERRRRWAESGKKGKYEAPPCPDTTNLPDLPEGWCWATVEQLASPDERSIQSGPFGSSLRHSEFVLQGKLVIGIDNVQDGYFSIGAEHRISDQKYKILQKFTARPGDVLVTVMATVGRTCVVPDDLETAIITKHVYRISPDQELVLPRFLHLCLWGGPVVREQMFGQVQGQTRPGLNGAIIKGLIIPLPPLDEQGRILGEAERLLSVGKATQAEMAQTERRLMRLRQSILKWAFEGKLADQDPSDEPASALLARIKAERDKTQPAKKKSRA